MARVDIYVQVIPHPPLAHTDYIEIRLSDQKRGTNILLNDITQH
jgi:hypothetical protein